jgi:quercetin dioxygenase-like cupin family protein
MFVVNFKEREELPVELPGSKNATMRWLVGKQDGARTYAMRFFEIKPGGIIPLHTHPEKHETFILEGEAKLLGSEGDAVAKKGDVVFVPPNQPHGYENTHGSKVFRSIDVIPLLKKD